MDHKVCEAIDVGVVCAVPQAKRMLVVRVAQLAQRPARQGGHVHAIVVDQLQR